MFSNNKHLSALSKGSQGWLLSALDPYHDYQYEVRGLPDERTAPSVVQIHNQSYSLVAPASASTGTFDAIIQYTGFNSEIGKSPGMVTQFGSGYHTYTSGSLSSGQPFGALNIWAGAAGSSWSTGSPITTGDINACLGSVKGTDRCRLIGVAFEVHNTTAEVYRQGTLTVAQLCDIAADNKSILYRDLNASPTVDTFVQSDASTLRASTLQPLLAVPGSQTWPAAKGIYAIPRMIDVPRQLGHYSSTTLPRTPIIYGTDGRVASLEPNNIAGAVPVPTLDPVQSSGFSPLQVYFTGLSNETALTVTLRTIVEYFPAVGSTLLPLSEPSPVYDPMVFGAYSAIIQEAPYAVPVGQNAAGDYFRKILKVVSTALDLTSPMFGSYAPLVASAAKGGKILSQLGSPPKKKVEKMAAGVSALQTRRRMR